MAIWADVHLSTTDPVLAALKVCEEAGEVAGAVVKSLDGSHRVHGDLNDELADVVLAVMTCANFAHINMDRSIKARLEHLEKRAMA